ncbi:hypothetical protein GOP47_0021117 [Adiantum capillus-veneris]|uniref:Thioredoxin domain-containing protein n=1 Tax=Adiantum capillus-veneris TaxID=13818 RepID=A0A9D4Z8D0_ADICA|nr:hypothetical protein GOP47_0021117 [Adiantum capillus-veneris]
MIDFYSSSCGACKYLLPQVINLCKKGCEDSCPVDDSWGIIFLKHNVRDDYDELTDLARFYAIRVVPSFTFFQNGSPIKHLLTRDKQRLQEAVCHVREWLLERS